MNILNVIYISLSCSEHDIQAGSRYRTLTAHELGPNNERTGRSWRILYKHSDWFLCSLRKAKRRLTKRIRLLTGNTPIICK